MATRSLVATQSRRYGTRMMTAGEPFEATGPEARLLTALGWAKDGEPEPVKAEAAPKKRKRRAKKATK